MKKRIIILTKSDKHSGHCIAGIDYYTGEWIRLVSSNLTIEGAVPDEQMHFDDGTELQVYDIIECELIKPMPKLVQPENWWYDETKKWKKVGISNKSKVLKIHGLDNPAFVFEDTETKLAANHQFSGKPSLLLLQISKAYVDVKKFPERTLVQLGFKYNNTDYRFFKITQKDIKYEYSRRAAGNYSIKNPCVAVFSLTDRYAKDGKYYKVVAQILE